MNILIAEMNKGMRKTIGKNKANSLMYIQSQNAKKTFKQTRKKLRTVPMNTVMKNAKRKKQKMQHH